MKTRRLISSALNNQVVHTYSVVARDKQTGHIGVAVQSHFFSVGSVVPWARAGVGAVATQSLVEVSYGPLGLKLMSSGKTSKEALASLVRSDSKPEVRQVAMVDASGHTAVHTGEKCIPFAGHVEDEENQFTVEANLMRNDKIWPAMAKAYRKSLSSLSGHPGNELADRLVATLQAAEEAGGDVRGKQSSALLVVEPKLHPNSWMGRVVELRVEDSTDPIPELKRLLRLHKAYRFANQGDDFLAKGESTKAEEAYEISAKLAPEVEELSFWRAVTLVQMGKATTAKPIFQKVFEKNKDWVEVTKSLPKCGLLTADPVILKQVLGVSE